jgi:hypothetical protein
MVEEEERDEMAESNAQATEARELTGKFRGQCPRNPRLS